MPQDIAPSSYFVECREMKQWFLSSLKLVAKAVQALPRPVREHSFSVCYWLGFSIFIFSFWQGWMYDDPFITYRYAENIARGVGFVYNPAERILSTTTPLFALLLALLARLGMDIPTAAHWIGAFSLAGGGWILWKLAQRLQTPWVGAAGLLLYPTFGLALATLGSETPLYITLCLASLAAYLIQRQAEGQGGGSQRLFAAALAAALAILARPDGVLAPAVLSFDLAWRLWCGRGWRLPPFGKKIAIPSMWAWAALSFLAILIPWALFGWAYFGSPVPVTLAAKQSQGGMSISQKFAAGFLALVQSYADRWNYWIMAALALLGLSFLFWRLFLPRSSTTHPSTPPIPSYAAWGLILAWTFLYFTAYSILGVSRYFWYYAPLVPGFVILVGLGLSSFAQMRWLRFRKLAAGVLGLLLVAQLFRLWTASQSPDARYPIYRAIGVWLSANTAPAASVGVLEVGIIGYYAQRRMIDFAGLLQPDVAAQMKAETTFDDTALWAAQQYQPTYIVQFDGDFLRLQNEFIDPYCQPVQKFRGIEYNFGRDLTIYQCAGLR